MAPELISAIAIVLVAVIEALATVDRKRAKKDREAAKQLEIARRRESILAIELTYASGKLAEATANALVKGVVNGQVSCAIEEFRKAETAYERFCLEQTHSNLGC